MTSLLLLHLRFNIGPSIYSLQNRYGYPLFAESFFDAVLESSKLAAAARRLYKFRLSLTSSAVAFFRRSLLAKVRETESRAFTTVRELFVECGILSRRSNLRAGTALSYLSQCRRC